MTQAPSWRSGLAYGLTGLPLAFVALPLYVFMPQYYAQQFGMPLAALGGVLLGARLLDALTDPFIGQGVDRLFRLSRRALLATLCAAALLLWLGFAGLFFPPSSWRASSSQLVAWAALSLSLTYLCYGLITIVHQAWAARLRGGDLAQSFWASWREGLALVGVLVASVLPGTFSMGVVVVVLAAVWVVALSALARAPSPSPEAHYRQASTPLSWADLCRPWKLSEFRGLLLAFLLNGIASAIPATLLLFFIKDRLQADGWEGVFLLIYFACAALAMPLWWRLVGRIGLERSWMTGMAVALAGFVGAAWLQSGDIFWFGLVCALSGLALGSDLALPAALLARVIVRHDDEASREGAYFGWWSSATKLNLAVAAGLALPLLEWLGYSPGAINAAGTRALTFSYAVLPCVLKVLTLVALWRWHRRFNIQGEPS